MHRRVPGGQGSTKSPAVPARGEIYLEFIPVGSQVKLVAVDAASGVEVTVFGPASVSRSDLERIAVRKLNRRLAALQSDIRA